MQQLQASQPQQELEHVLMLLQSHRLAEEDLDRVITTATEMKEEEHRRIRTRMEEEEFVVTKRLRVMWFERSKAVLVANGDLPSMAALNDDEMMDVDNWDALRDVLETTFISIPDMWRCATTNDDDENGCDGANCSYELSGKYVCRFQPEFMLCQNCVESFDPAEEMELLHDVAYDECDLFYDYLAGRWPLQN